METLCFFSLQPKKKKKKGGTMVKGVLLDWRKIQIFTVNLLLHIHAYQIQRITHHTDHAVQNWK